MAPKRIIKRSYGPHICPFCQQKTTPDYKDLQVLGRFVSERGKMLSRLRTGVCAKHQRILAEAIKRARFLSMLPYITQV